MIDFIYYVGGHGALNLFDMIPIFLYMIFAGQQCKTEFIPHLRPIFYRFTSNLYRETFLLSFAEKKIMLNEDLIKNLTIFNIIRWVSGSMGRPSI